MLGKHCLDGCIVSPNRRFHRSAFTLVELLITISVIALLASTLLFALYSAQETARTQKTKSLIAKLDSIIKAKHESYKTRRVPISLGADTFTDRNSNGVRDFGEPLINDWNGDGSWNASVDPQLAAKIRLDCLRDQMRMELPDRWSDILDDPVTPFGAAEKIARPSVSEGYRRRANAGTPTDQYQGAECLYLIVAAAEQGDGDAHGSIKSDQIGDIDGDGFPEFIDAWGRPIEFLRSAPGFPSDLQIVGRGTANTANVGRVTWQDPTLSTTPGSYVGGILAKPDPTYGTPSPESMVRITRHTAKTTVFPPEIAIVSELTGSAITTSQPFIILPPDPFDPRGASSKPSFALYPLIYSAGPDHAYGILADSTPKLHYSASGVQPVSPIGPFLTKLVGSGGAAS